MPSTVFALISLDKQNMILGFTWLQKHNSKVDWAWGKVTMSWCLQRCSAYATKAREECQAEVQECTALQACCAGHLFFADLDLLDPLPLSFPHKVALYKNNWSSGGALEEELREEFGGICDLKLPDKAVKVGDWIYTTTLYSLLSAIEIWASQITS
ncbi:hypothetical protein C0989_003870 [Termitomyces sp. Mn162]|nr:hypothetical protein C0989_003870 [Termitomyces sp. Mn162]